VCTCVVCTCVVCVCTCVRVCGVCVCVVCVWVCVCCVHVCMCACVCWYVCMCVCVVCMWVQSEEVHVGINVVYVVHKQVTFYLQRKVAKSLPLLSIKPLDVCRLHSKRFTFSPSTASQHSHASQWALFLFQEDSLTWVTCTWCSNQLKQTVLKKTATPTRGASYVVTVTTPILKVTWRESHDTYPPTQFLMGFWKIQVADMQYWAEMEWSTVVRKCMPTVKGRNFKQTL